MKQFFDPEGTVVGLRQCLEKCSGQPETSGLLVLCADGNNLTPEALDPVMRQATHPIAGGIFPGIIHNGRLHKKGTLVICLPGAFSIQVIKGLSDPDADFEESLIGQIADNSQVRTLILFVDGFATRISSFIESLFNVFGLDLNYVGGGAGSLSMARKPYLLTNEGMMEDCAVLAFLTTESGIGVSHGWKELSGPYQVTSAEANVIHSIEWQPAFDFYRRIIYYHTGATVDRNDFYAIAQHHPFGIARLNGEQIIRDPIQVGADESLICVGEVQTGAFISVMKGDADLLVRAAAESLARALETFPADRQARFRFFVDCISRVIVLGTRFRDEIEAVQDHNASVSGVCSMGEIANSGTDFLEWYNKTSVMAVLG